MVCFWYLQEYEANVAKRAHIQEFINKFRYIVYPYDSVSISVSDSVSDSVSVAAGNVKPALYSRFTLLRSTITRL